MLEFRTNHTAPKSRYQMNFRCCASFNGTPYGARFEFELSYSGRTRVKRYVFLRTRIKLRVRKTHAKSTSEAMKGKIRGGTRGKDGLNRQKDNIVQQSTACALTREKTFCTDGRKKQTIQNSKYYSVSMQSGPARYLRASCSVSLSSLAVSRLVPCWRLPPPPTAKVGEHRLILRPK